MDGIGPDEHNVVALSLARLERMIQLRLAEADPGLEPSVVVRVCMDHDLSPIVANNPELYEEVVDRIVESLDDVLDARAPVVEPSPTDLFIGRLRCMSCRAVTHDASSGCESFLRGGVRGETFHVGSEFVFRHEDVAADYYIRTKRPSPGEAVHILEGWECPRCRGLNWAEVVIRDTLVSSVWSVALSPHTLERAHYVTSECVDLVARLTGRPTWALLHEEVFELLVHTLKQAGAPDEGH